MHIIVISEKWDNDFCGAEYMGDCGGEKGKDHTEIELKWK